MCIVSVLCYHFAYAYGVFISYLFLLIIIFLSCNIRYIYNQYLLINEEKYISKDIF